MLFILNSCEKDEPLIDPIINEFSVVMSADTIGSIATFAIDVEADRVSFWSGMSKNDYEAIKDEVEPLIGIPVSENPRFRPINTGTDISPETKALDITYKEEGSFTAVLIATNIEDYTGVMKRTIKKVNIEIKKP